MTSLSLVQAKRRMELRRFLGDIYTPVRLGFSQRHAGRTRSQPPSCLEIPSQAAGSRSVAALRCAALRGSRIERLALGAEFRHRNALVKQATALGAKWDRRQRMRPVVVILSGHPSPLIISILFQISVHENSAKLHTQTPAVS